MKQILKQRVKKNQISSKMVKSKRRAMILLKLQKMINNLDKERKRLIVPFKPQRINLKIKIKEMVIRLMLLKKAPRMIHNLQNILFNKVLQMVSRERML